MTVLKKDCFVDSVCVFRLVFLYWLPSLCLSKESWAWKRGNESPLYISSHFFMVKTDLEVGWMVICVLFLTTAKRFVSVDQHSLEVLLRVSLWTLIVSPACSVCVQCCMETNDLLFCVQWLKQVCFRQKVNVTLLYKGYKTWALEAQLESDVCKLVLSYHRASL